MNSPESPEAMSDTSSEDRLRQIFDNTIDDACPGGSASAATDENLLEKLFDMFPEGLTEITSYLGHPSAGRGTLPCLPEI